MDERVWLALSFALGILLESIILLKNHANKTLIIKFLGVLLTSAVVLFFPMIQISERIFLASSIFIFISSVAFKNAFLPKISEQTTLIYTIIIWYIAYTSTLEIDLIEGQSLNLFPSLVFCLFLPTLGVLANAFFNFKITRFWRITLYSWFLIISFVIAIIQFSYIYNPFDGGFLQNIAKLSPTTMLLMGANSLYLVSNLIYLKIIFSLADTRQEFREKLEIFGLMIQKFESRQSRPLQSLFILIFFGGFFFANLNYSLLNQQETLIFSVSLGYVFSYYYSQKHLQRQTDLKSKLELLKRKSLDTTEDWDNQNIRN